MKCCGIQISSKKIIWQNSYFLRVQIYRLSSIFDMYIHKYAYFNITMPNCLGRLTPFKHSLNGLNTKQRVTNCLPFNVQENIANNRCTKLNDPYFKVEHPKINRV